MNTKYKHILFDIDGTILDTEQTLIASLQQTILTLQGRQVESQELLFALGIPGEVTLKQLGIDDTKAANALWNQYFKAQSHAIQPFEGIEEAFKELKKRGCRLGIITSKNREQYHNDFIPFGLDHYFDTVICADDSTAPKPSPQPMYAYLQQTQALPQEVLYIGDTLYDQQCASEAGVDFGLALWGCHSARHIYATYYFSTPHDLHYTLHKTTDAYADVPWLKWAMELQFISQAGITYSRDPFDQERFERLRQISAEMMSLKSGLPLNQVNELFCNETGFQTPKLDTRAAIFQEHKILLVEESNGTWSLPGGWVDVDQSIKSNTQKEVKEEAGLDVVPVKLIALQDRKQHNQPPYAYGVCKAFVLCEIIGGEFIPNTETLQTGFFTLDNLPPLAQEKNNQQQIALCFAAHWTESWTTVFD